jgi:pilus assembly protein Flp/PilA
VKTAVNMIWKLRIWGATHGQDLIECALVASLVAILAGAIVPVVATSISKVFSHVASNRCCQQQLTRTFSAKFELIERRQRILSGHKKGATRAVATLPSHFCAISFRWQGQHATRRYHGCDLRVVHVLRTPLNCMGFHPSSRTGKNISTWAIPRKSGSSSWRLRPSLYWRFYQSFC